MEDDPLNWEITEALSKSCGATVSSVGDGHAALRILAKESFDLILMDIQMPGLDGIETTRKIRTLPSAAKTPIIALTANALPDDREHYLAEGMDDYLTKPINPETLHITLLRWQPQRQIAEQKTTGWNNNAEKLSFESLENAGVATQTALQNLLGNEELYLRLLERFVHERGHFPEEINEAMQRQDFDTLRELTHSLRSLAASLDLHALANQSALLENVIVKGEPIISVDELTIQFRQDLTLIRAWLDQLALAEK